MYAAESEATRQSLVTLTSDVTAIHQAYLQALFAADNGQKTANTLSIRILYIQSTTVLRIFMRRTTRLFANDVRATSRRTYKTKFTQPSP